jgi:hypothetical protein
VSHLERYEPWRNGPKRKALAGQGKRVAIRDRDDLHVIFPGFISNVTYLGIEVK